MSEFVELIQKSAAGTTLVNPITYTFTINPDMCAINGGHNLVKKRFPGKDGAVYQNLGRTEKTIILSGTLYAGYSYKNQVEYAIEDLRKDFQRFADAKAVFDLVGAFSSFIGAISVVIPTNALTFNAKRPNSFDYTLTLSEWTDFTVTSAKVDLNLTSETNAAKKFADTLRLIRLRRASAGAGTSG